MTTRAGNFNRLELPALTGQSRAHVIEIGEPACMLHPAAADAMHKMRAAGAQAGIDLTPVSSFRSFEHQLLIWNGKFRGQRPLLDRHGEPLEVGTMDEAARVEAILVWSALPGASRHHWGTEIDVIDRAALAPGERAQLVASEYSTQGVFAGLAGWLGRHAADYGFFHPYDMDRGGVQPEPWHLSFAPVAAPALTLLTLDVLATALIGVEIEGRATVLTRLPELHQRYVMSVAPPTARALAAVAL